MTTALDRTADILALATAATTEPAKTEFRARARRDVLFLVAEIQRLRRDLEATAERLAEWEGSA
ncbi:hypothetical protein [Streptomyces sp. SCSIO ZS0520]|uniref:hypothetical protein n=1 Tax=Streptomyces sp. SCSIO ZS0520 TaxID=2892996 RepID=UPI0021DA852C|nr:hypothetical protein [Streptomyces sp. SCSIO ZS0520]